MHSNSPAFLIQTLFLVEVPGLLISGGGFQATIITRYALLQPTSIKQAGWFLSWWSWCCLITFRSVMYGFAFFSHETSVCRSQKVVDAIHHNENQIAEAITETHLRYLLDHNGQYQSLKHVEDTAQHGVQLSAHDQPLSTAAIMPSEWCQPRLIISPIAGSDSIEQGL